MHSLMLPFKRNMFWVIVFMGSPQNVIALLMPTIKRAEHDCVYAESIYGLGTLLNDGLTYVLVYLFIYLCQFSTCT